MRRIAIIDGHPEANPARFCHALADAYAEGASDAGHIVARIDIAEMEVSFLRSKSDWEQNEASPAIRRAQEIIARANHLVIIYPLWLGGMPAMLKAFFEQALRPGFAFSRELSGLNAGLLRGKSAHVVITMGMPAAVFRFFFLAHSLRSFKRNVLRFCGIGNIRDTLIGNIEGRSAEDRKTLLADMRQRGVRAA